MKPHPVLYIPSGWRGKESRNASKLVNQMCLRCVRRESNPRTWRPFNPASIIGLSRIRGCLQERAPSQPPRPTTAVAVRGGRGVAETGRTGGRTPSLPRGHALFPRRGIRCRWPRAFQTFDWKFLETREWRAQCDRWPHRGTLLGALSRRLGVEKEESIYLTCRTVWSLRMTFVAVRGSFVIYIE